MEKQAEAEKLKAEALKDAVEQEAIGIKARGEAEAAATKVKGAAEAAAIQAKGEAEAVAMEKKAEAFAKYDKAAVIEMLIGVMPEIAGKIAEPLAQIDKITIIGGGDGGSGIDSVAGNVPIVMAKMFETVREATGIDMTELIKADTYDAKVNRNVNISGLTEDTGSQAGAAAAVIYESQKNDDNEN